MISIIIPVFNVELHLSRCLDSVLQQSYKNLEIICINDGSTDSSLSILQNYAKLDSRIVIINQENEGMSIARNAGLEIAKGKYIGFVDSDDYIEPNMFELMHKQIEADKCDLVGCGTNIIYEAWSDFKDGDEQYFKIKIGVKQPVGPGLLLNMSICVWNKLFKKEIIDRYHLRFPPGLWYEDAVFVWCYVSVSETLSFFEQKLYNYVRYQKSIMGTTFGKSQRALDHIHISKEVYVFLKKNNKYHIFSQDFLSFATHNMYLSFHYLPLQNKYKAILPSLRFLSLIGFLNTFKVFCCVLTKVLKKV